VGFSSPAPAAVNGRAFKDAEVLVHCRALSDQPVKPRKAANWKEPSRALDKISPPFVGRVINPNEAVSASRADVPMLDRNHGLPTDRGLLPSAGRTASRVGWPQGGRTGSPGEVRRREVIRSSAMRMARALSYSARTVNRRPAALQPRTRQARSASMSCRRISTAVGRKMAARGLCG
jgi:hypothetical protein